MWVWLTCQRFELPWMMEEQEMWWVWPVTWLASQVEAVSEVALSCPSLERERERERERKRERARSLSARYTLTHTVSQSLTSSTGLWPLSARDLHSEWSSLTTTSGSTSSSSARGRRGDSGDRQSRDSWAHGWWHHRSGRRRVGWLWSTQSWLQTLSSRCLLG